MKYIAAILMLIDHVGLLFFPNQLIWRIVGRLAMPLFAYGIAMGFKNTSNLKAYMLRIGLFAIASQFPFLWMVRLAYGNQFVLNIGFTFFAAILVLWCLEQARKEKGVVKIGLFLMICLLGYGVELFHADYGLYGILTIVIFYEYAIRQQKIGEAQISFTLLTFIEAFMPNNQLQAFAIFSLVLIEPLKKLKWKAFRYFFYLFYPLHMLILCLIKIMY